MTTLPTREQVDAALATLRDEVECCGTADCAYCGAVVTLLTEVSALLDAVARVEDGLCGMNHADSLIRVEDIRKALRGES